MNPKALTGSQLAVSSSLLAGMRPALVSFFLRRSRNAADAEDLAQEVIARALVRARAISVDTANRYVFRIAVNLWRDRMRRELVQVVAAGRQEQTRLRDCEERSPERVVVVQEELSVVTAALMQLDERTRDVFVLHRLEHMKQAQIARLLGMSVSSVEKRIAGALAEIARRLDRTER